MFGRMGGRNRSPASLLGLSEVSRYGNVVASISDGRGASDSDAVLIDYSRPVSFGPTGKHRFLSPKTSHRKNPCRPASQETEVRAIASFGPNGMPSTRKINLIGQRGTTEGEGDRQHGLVRFVAVTDGVVDFDILAFKEKPRHAVLGSWRLIK